MERVGNVGVPVGGRVVDRDRELHLQPAGQEVEEAAVTVTKRPAVGAAGAAINSTREEKGVKWRKQTKTHVCTSP